MPPIRSYDGAFSFTTSRLHANLERTIPGYDKKDPKTWPFVTLAVVEQHSPYYGVPDLPTGVAYERAVTKRYEQMYTATERTEIASMNGSFHDRCPFNYDEHDNPKEEVGMSSVEYQEYTARFAAPDIDELRYPERNPISEVSKDTDREPCTNSECMEVKREVARLQGELFDKSSQLLSSQEYVREYEATEGQRRNAIQDVRHEYWREQQRAEAAEEECMARMEENTQLLRQIRELETKISQKDYLEAYCARLEARMRATINDLNGTAVTPTKRGHSQVAEPDSEPDIDVDDDKMLRSDGVLED